MNRALGHGWQPPWQELPEGFDLAAATDEQLAELALDAAEATFWWLVGRVVKKQAIYLLLGRHDASSPTYWSPLAERAINEDQWTGDYRSYGQGKATITSRTLLSSRVVLTTRRDLLRPDDVEYWGSVLKEIEHMNTRGRMTILTAIGAASGQKERVDEFLAQVGVDALDVLCFLRNVAQELA
jgi:hypothetical protein